MTKEELEKDYYADRPTEPYSNDNSPNDWANIAHYAEENLEKTFERIAELEEVRSKQADLINRDTIRMENQKYQIKKLEKENAEYKEKISYLKDNLRVAREDREKLQLDVAKGLKEFVKDFPVTAIRYLANEEYVERLTKAKEIIEELLKALDGRSGFDEDVFGRAEQFLKEK